MMDFISVVMEPSAVSVCLGNMGNEAKVKVVYLQQSLSMLSANAAGKESTQFKVWIYSAVSL